MGVPLRVLLSAFPALTMAWYSRVWGGTEDGVDENVLVVGTAREPLEARKYSGPVARALDPDLVDEYELSDVPMAKFGIRETRESFDVEPESRVAAAIWIHDDCFFSARVTDGAALKRLIESILSMHSYYLGEDVDWGQVPDSVVRIVQSAKKIRLTSVRETKRFTVLEEVSGFRWQFWKEAYRESLACGLVDGKAVLY